MHAQYDIYISYNIGLHLLPPIRLWLVWFSMYSVYYGDITGRLIDHVCFKMAAKFELHLYCVLVFVMV